MASNNGLLVIDSIHFASSVATYPSRCHSSAKAVGFSLLPARLEAVRMNMYLLQQNTHAGAVLCGHLSDATRQQPAGCLRSAGQSQVMHRWQLHATYLHRLVVVTAQSADARQAIHTRDKQPSRGLATMRP